MEDYGDLLDRLTPALRGQARWTRLAPLRIPISGQGVYALLLGGSAPLSLECVRAMRRME